MQRIIKGDQVVVITGRDRGTKGVNGINGLLIVQEIGIYSSISFRLHI